MPFQPLMDQEFVIDGVSYRIGEHPAARGRPYAQEGQQATVYQLVAADGMRRALKVFSPKWRLPTQMSLASKLEAYAEVPGLSVCRRTVLSPLKHPALLRQHQDLAYAVLMPWIEGPTWAQVLVSRGNPPWPVLTPQRSQEMARRLAGVLAGMEARDLAHCDLSGPNLMLPMLEPASQSAPISLVDVEQLCAPDLPQPELLPDGLPGYVHRSVPHGHWGSIADRFAGALLLAEVLGWCEGRVCQAAWGASYFDSAELQQEGPRYQLLWGVLNSRWGAHVAALFERAWRSPDLAGCPRLDEWSEALWKPAEPAVPTGAEAAAPVAAEGGRPPGPGVVMPEAPPAPAEPVTVAGEGVPAAEEPVVAAAEVEPAAEEAALEPVAAEAEKVAESGGEVVLPEPGVPDSAAVAASAIVSEEVLAGQEELPTRAPTVQPEAGIQPTAGEEPPRAEPAPEATWHEEWVPAAVILGLVPEPQPSAPTMAEQPPELPAIAETPAPLPAAGEIEVPLSAAEVAWQLPAQEPQPASLGIAEPPAGPSSVPGRASEIGPSESAAILDLSRRVSDMAHQELAFEAKFGGRLQRLESEMASRPAVEAAPRDSRFLAAPLLLWVLLMALGWAAVIVFPLFTAADQWWMLLIAWAATGAAVGLLQWLVAVRIMPGAVLWVVFSAAGWAGAWLLAGYARNALESAWLEWFRRVPLETPESLRVAVGWNMTWLLALLFCAAFNAAGAAWLFARARRRRA